MIKKNILCPVDFSKSTQKTIEHAIHLAKWFNAQLTVLTVVELLPGSNFTSVNTEMEKQAYKNLDKLAEQYHLNEKQIQLMTGYPLQQGYAKEIILKFAKEKNIDLIVVGSHGHYGIGHHLIGSTTRILANDADCDVFIVHVDETP